MDGRIGAAHTRYLVPATMPGAHGTIPDLERILQNHLAQACESVFSQLMGSDSAVYVVHEVEARLAISSFSATISTSIADAWAERIAGGAARILVHGDEGIDFVRFEDQADFVAQFLAYLVHDNAGQLWYYGAFSSYLKLTVEDAIVCVLQDNRKHLTAILRLLRRRGQLEKILSRLTPETASRAGQLCESLATDYPRIEAWRPLLRAALGIAEELGASVTTPNEDDTSWYESLVLSLCSPSLTPNWNDLIQLSSHVHQILSFMTQTGHVRWPSTSARELNTARLKEILNAHFDWLDLDWLVPRLSILWSSIEPEGIDVAPQRSLSLTPRQKEFLDVFLKLAQESKLELNLGRVQTAHDRLRIQAALAQFAPDFADDPQLLVLLDAILLVREQVSEPTAKWNAILHSQVEHERARNVVQRLGPTAQTVLDALSAMVRPESARQTDRIIETDCGALFLLTRAVIDLRLDAVLKSAGCSAPEPFLAGIAYKFGGVLDEAGLLWSGYRGEDPWTDLAGFPVARFQEALFKQVVGQQCGTHHICRIEEIVWRGQLTTAGSASTGVDWLLGMRNSADALFDRWSDLTEGPVTREPARRSFFDSMGRLAMVVEAWQDELDLVLTITAGCVVRAWARWLRGLAGSTPAYLLKNALDRRALVRENDHFLEVTLASAPLDSVVELSGYFAPIPHVSWLGGREMRFLRGSL